MQRLVIHVKDDALVKKSSFASFVMLSLSKHAVISMFYIHPSPRQARDKLKLRVTAVTFYEVVIIEALKKNPVVIQTIEKIGLERIAVSVVTVMELYFTMYRCRDNRQTD